MITRDDGLTNEEGIIMDNLVSAFNGFNALEKQHPLDLQEFASGINCCQELLALRIARRVYPLGWPNTMGEKECD